MSISESLRTSLDYHSLKHVTSTRSALLDSYELHLDHTPHYTLDNLEVPAVGWESDRLVTICSSQVLLPLLCNSGTQQVFRVGAKVLLVEDDYKVGASAETLLCDILDDWCHRRSKYEGLCSFEIVVAIEAETLVREGLWSTLQELAPGIFQKYGDDLVEEWVSSAKLLLLVNNWPTSTSNVNSRPSDDQEGNKINLQEESALLEETIKYYADELSNTKFIIFVSDQSVEKWLATFNDGLGIPTQIVKITKKINVSPVLTKKNQLNLVNWAANSLWKTNFILHWPRCRQGLILHMLNNDASLCSAKTSCDLLWSVLQFLLSLFKKHTNCSTQSCSNLFDSLCHMAYDTEYKAVETDHYYENVQVTAELKQKFLHYFLLILPKLPPIENDQYCLFINAQLQHVLASRYIYASKLSIGISLNPLKDRDEVAVMLLGHLRRDVLNEHSLFDNKVVHRELKSLYLMNENSKDPQAYLLHMLGELHGENRLIDLLFKDAVFPRQLELFDNCLMKEFLLQYVTYVQPRRLLLLVRRGYVPVELISIVSVLGDLDLSFGLGLMHHLERGSSATSDEVLLSALSASRARLQDFLGCLTFSAIDKLTPSTAARLTCIRVRVTSEMALRKLFSVQSTLPNLMWFETDFDLPLELVFNAELPCVKTPLCDFTFFGVRETQLSSVITFITKVRKNYLSGLHIHHSSLNTNSAITLVEKLRDKDVLLSTPCEVVALYRRWRYAEVAVLDAQQLMDEDKVRPLLGYDDRHQYSDNEIRSSVTTTDADIVKLTNFLELENSIIYFQFGSSNIVLTKNSDGRIEVKKYKFDKGFNV
ncbi:hypothetical protein FHG87_004927 [Trinorchestia longiramus]|nr:hypothetical protein FHG87_004927 [Trinorchestia longiramus]